MEAFIVFVLSQPLSISLISLGCNESPFLLFDMGERSKRDTALATSS
jgi:hypothetical protein